MNSLPHVLEAWKNADEMSCFRTFFKDETANEYSIYSFARALDNTLLPKFK